MTTIRSTVTIRNLKEVSHGRCEDSTARNNQGKRQHLLQKKIHQIFLLGKEMLSRLSIGKYLVRDLVGG
jgi:hypothetical protein